MSVVTDDGDLRRHVDAAGTQLELYAGREVVMKSQDGVGHRVESQQVRHGGAASLNVAGGHDPADDGVIAQARLGQRFHEAPDPPLPAGEVVRRALVLGDEGERAAALRQARLGVAAAWADARGDAVAAARVQVQIARATMAAARADLAAAKTADETNAARIAILNAQAAIIAANAQVQQAQTDLVQSQYEVSIALAEAAGKTVLAAERQLGAARAALRAAMKRSGGKATAEVNQARAEAIRAEASLRDARLQDDLDTIDFNLQMGRITQSSAIAALREILRTRELTRDQRRQLLLQIKGMQDEMADSQWNFGNIKLPTPYQMRRYIEERRQQFRNEMDAAAAGRSFGASSGPASGMGGSVVTNNNETTIQINGADLVEVKRIIREVVGGRASLNRTTGARRR